MAHGEGPAVAVFPFKQSSCAYGNYGKRLSRPICIAWIQALLA